MPKRRKLRHSSSVSHRDIEALRRAIAEGYPWFCHARDNVYRRTGLTTTQNILLSYITGISAGVAVYLAGEDHPSRETVAAVKAELETDIAAAEKRFKSIFNGKRYGDSFFRYLNPNSPPRNEF